MQPSPPPVIDHAALLGLLQDRLGAPAGGLPATIALQSRAEYDAIPARWHFYHRHAFFQLKAKHWSAAGEDGTATFSRWGSGNGEP